MNRQFNKTLSLSFYFSTVIQTLDRSLTIFSTYYVDAFFLTLLNTIHSKTSRLHSMLFAAHTFFSCFWMCFVPPKNDKLSIPIISMPVTVNLILPFFSSNQFEWNKLAFKNEFQELKAFWISSVGIHTHFWILIHLV